MEQGLLDVGLSQREDERVGERLEDDEDVPDRVQHKQRSTGEVVGSEAAAALADQQVVEDSGQPAAEARQHDQERDAGGANILGRGGENRRKKGHVA